MHASAGANPIWTVDGDGEGPAARMSAAAGAGINPLYYGGDGGDYDAYSSAGSGDSVLIGVEDNQDFRDYEGHKNVRKLCGLGLFFFFFFFIHDV